MWSGSREAISPEPSWGERGKREGEAGGEGIRICCHEQVQRVEGES